MTSKATALDPEKDFETPTKKQHTLVEEDKNAEAAVQDGFALATFVRPHFDRDEKDHPFVSYEISLPLTDEHKRWVPDEIGEAWEVAKDHGYKVQDIAVENQACEILLAPKMKEGGLKVDTAEIEQAAISTITEKGTGEEREVIRLKFRVRMELDNDTGRFCRVHFGHNVWLKLQPLQRKLIK